MTEYIQKHFSGERAVYKEKDVKIIGCVFEDGESPIKECSDIQIEQTLFRWRYPIWYAKNISVKDSQIYSDGRAGMWYVENLSVTDTIVAAPKTVRRCDGVTLTNVYFPDAQETIWHCKNVKLVNVQAKGDYFCMNSENLEIENLKLDGKYSFDGVKNVVIRNSRLCTKDAFWNTENVTVYDSFITSEYLGWNAKNLTFVNCTIESLQGMCYIDNLVMKNCRLINTTLAFEFSSVDADIRGHIDSVFNPSSGTIRADSIGELILEKDLIDTTKTKILCSTVDADLTKPDWKK